MGLPSPSRNIISVFGLALAMLACRVSTSAELELPKVRDHAGDDGTQLDIQFGRVAGATLYEVATASEYHGVYSDPTPITPPVLDSNLTSISGIINQLQRGQAYWVRVKAIDAAGQKRIIAESPATAGVVPTRDWYDSSRVWLLLVSTIVCGTVFAYVIIARRGGKIHIRTIAGLEALEDAVGRATETGRSCLFVPGIQDINEIQTIAGLTILGRVAERAAEYDCELICPTSKSLVMTAARETVAAAFFAAGKPDAYREDAIYYVTDEQFGYVAHLTGRMVREKPAACFYLGSFYAESLILAEVGNAVGAIQIAGTAQPSQMPFFVAACDYTLIGEEFFAASAYLSRDPDQLGSLKGQDVGKMFTVALMLCGVLLATVAELANTPTLNAWRAYLEDTVLNG